MTLAQDLDATEVDMRTREAQALPHRLSVKMAPPPQACHRTRRSHRDIATSLDPLMRYAMRPSGVRRDGFTSRRTRRQRGQAQCITRVNGQLTYSYQPHVEASRTMVSLLAPPRGRNRRELGNRNWQLQQRVLGVLGRSDKYLERRSPAGKCCLFRDRLLATLPLPHSKSPLPSLTANATVALLLTLSSTGRTEEGATPTECPSRDMVTIAVRGLLNQSHVEVPDLESKFEIRDHGQTYSVTAHGRTRDYDDEGRDCIRRARVAAVFVALTLVPPDIYAPDQTSLDDVPTAATSEPAPPPPVPPTRPTVTAPIPTKLPQPVRKSTPLPSEARIANTPDNHWQFGIELGALGTTAPRSEQSLTALGAEMRFVLTRPNWGIVLGGVITTGDESTLGTSTVSQKRVPFDLGLRLNWDNSWLTSALDLGPTFAVLQLQQSTPPGSPSSTTVEVGARAAATGLVGHSTTRPFIRGFTEFLPFTHDLAVEPRGTIGRTSRFWLGVSIGLAVVFN